MSDTTFELSLTLPRDPRFANTARDLAVQAAKQAGCTDIDAQKFGRRVEGTIRECLERRETRDTLPVVVRCTDGPVEVLVDGQAMAVKA